MSNVDFTLAFIGGGNMATSLIRGLLNSGFSPQKISVSDPVAAQLETLSELGVQTFTTNDDAVAGRDAVVLAVKPQVAQKVVAELNTLQPHQLLISIVAGINTASLYTWANPEQAIVRCMPNTPALLGAGMSALFAGQRCQPDQRHIAETLLSATGKTLWVDHEQALDAVTAISGSGPAYFFLLMEAMIDTGIDLGLDRETATNLTLQTAFGAALMAQKSDESPGVLRHNVTSPGGTTAAALAVMMDAQLPDIIERALHAANTRAGELAEEFGGNI